MSKAKTAPSPEHRQAILDFIDTEGHRRAADQMAGIRFMESTPNGLVVGQGTKDQVKFTLNPDGTLSAQPAAALNAPINPTHKTHSPFTIAWHSIIEEAYSRLHHAVRAIAPIEDWMHQGEEETRRGPLPRKLNQTALAIAAQSGRGYVRDPHRLGIHEIRKLAGTGSLSMTCRIFGYAATLSDLNTFIRNRDRLTEAYRRQPNAAILYARIPRHGHGEPWPEPETMIEQAQHEFNAVLRRIGPQFDADPQTAWNSFLRLSVRFAREAGDRHWEPAVKTACDAAEAGVTPSYTAATAIKNAYAIIPERCALNRPFIRESAQKGVHQGRLAQQYQLLMNPLTGDGPPAVNPETPWNELLRRARIESASLDEVPQTLKMRRHRKAAQPARRNPSPEERKSRMERNLLLEEQLAVIAAGMKDAADGAVRILRDDHRVRVIRRDRQEPALTVTRAPNGALSIHGPGYEHRLTTLPDPDQPEDDPQRPTVRGAFQQQVIAMAHRHTGARYARQLANLALRQWAEDEAYRQRNFDQCLDQQLAQAIAGLIDPETAGLCRRITGRLALQHYNNAARWAGFLPELSRTNPGVAAIAFLDHRIEGREFNHPGQMITAVKQTAGRQADGAPLTPGQWSFIAGMPAATVCAAFRNHDGDDPDFDLYDYSAGPNSAGRAMTMLKAMATVRTVMNPGQIALLQRSIDTIEQSCPPKSSIFRQAAIILCRDLAAGASIPDDAQMREIGDYLAGQIREQQTEITARTVKGLLKASARWHRRIMAQRMEHEWRHRLERNNGRYAAWNDLLGAVSLNGFEFAPITDAFALLEEGYAMNHCVGYAGYEEQCIRGDSRIFSVRHDGARAATVQLSRQDGQWRQEQTRGKHNAPADDSLTEAAETLAGIYQQAYAAADGKKLRSWLKDASWLHGASPARTS